MLERTKVNDKNLLIKLKSFIEFQEISKIYYSSVNSEFEHILHLTFENDIELINILNQMETQKIINFDAVAGMGTDRKLSLIGGLSLASPPLVTIDCGTAITINVLGQKNICAGGIIFPGIKLQERSLREMTSGLKNFDLKIPNRFTGNSTSEAISIGIYQGIANAISGFVESIKNESFPDDELNIFLTGGSSSLILPMLKSHFQFSFEEKLNLLGMMFLSQQSGLL